MIKSKALTVPTEFTCVLDGSGTTGLSMGDSAQLDFGIYNFSLAIKAALSDWTPASNKVIYHKHDGAVGVIVTVLTTGIIRTTINATNYDSTVAPTTIPGKKYELGIGVTRETTTAAGSVVYTLNGVQLGASVAITARTEKITNGTFASDITAWTLATGSGGTISWVAGKLRAERVTVGTAAYQAISMAAGEQINVSVAATWVSGASTKGGIVIRSNDALSGPTLAAAIQTAAGASSTLTISYTSPSAQTVYVHLQTSDADGIYDYGDVTSSFVISADNARSLYVCGTSSTQTAGQVSKFVPYNRALSVAEFLTRFNSGVSTADQYGSNTASWTSNFTTVDGFVPISTPVTLTANVDGISDGSVSKDNCLRLNKTAELGSTAAVKTSGTLFTDLKNSWFRASVYVPAGQTYIDGFIITRGAVISASTTIFDGTGMNGQWVDIAGDALYVSTTVTERVYVWAKDGASTSISASAVGEVIYLADASHGRAGATLSLPSSGLTVTDWQDASTNNVDASFPGAGSSVRCEIV